jgi:hypothetical protein
MKDFDSPKDKKALIFNSMLISYMLPAMNLLKIGCFIFDIDFPAAKILYLLQFQLSKILSNINPFKDYKTGKCVNCKPSV